MVQLLQSPFGGLSKGYGWLKQIRSKTSTVCFTTCKPVQKMRAHHFKKSKPEQKMRAHHFKKSKPVQKMRAHHFK